MRRAATTFLAFMLPALAEAAPMEITCPIEGNLSGELTLPGGVPNPAAGWEYWLEGEPLRLQLSLLSKSDPPAWRITCFMHVKPNGIVDLSMTLGGGMKCR